MEVDIQRISYFVEKQPIIKDEILKLLTLWQSAKPSKPANAQTHETPPLVRQHTGTLQKNEESGKKQRRINMILSKVSFKCRPGTVTVLFGTGYDFQRKLIEIIALRQTSGYLSGKITYDNVTRKNGWFKDIVHIAFNKNSQLSERYYNGLSVFEYLFYGARLRISHGDIECRERTRNAIKLIGLDGSSLVHSLTSSEVRMLSIAVELVGNPTLLCIENPIDGLDASGSIEVVSLLRKIAKRPTSPTTIVYVVKYLDSDMLRYIDNVCLLADQKLLRFQEIHKSSMNVESLSKIKELIVEASIQLKAYNDATAAMSRRVGILGIFTSTSKIHINGVLRRIGVDMDQITQAAIRESASSTNENGNEGNSTPSRYDSMYSSTTWSQPNLDALYSATDTHEYYAAAHKRLGQSGQPLRGHKPIYQEVFILVSRGYKHYMKNAILIRLYFVRLTVAGVIVGAFVINNGEELNNDDDQVFYSADGLITYQVYNTTSVMFILASMSIVGTVFAIIIIHTNISILKYEIASGLHNTISCWLSLILVDLPIFLASAIVFATIVWACLGTYNNPFHIFIGVMILISIAGYSLALAVAVWTKTSNAALLYFSFYGSFSILFTGYLQAIPDLPGAWQWATTTAFSRWAFEALLLQEFDNTPNYSAYLDTFGFDGHDSSISFSITWLILWCIVLQIVVIIGLFPPIYDTNFFKDRTGNHVNRRLIQEALEMDEDDVVIVEELDFNTDRNRHAGSLLITSPLTQAMMIPARTSSLSDDRASGGSRFLSKDLALVKDVQTIPLTSQVILSFKNLKYVDRLLNDVQISSWNDNDNASESSSGSLTGRNDPLIQTGPSSIAYNQRIEPLFQGVSGNIKPGKACCIIDASNRGIGKVLLQILSSHVAVINKKRFGTTYPGKLYGSIVAKNLSGNPVKFTNSAFIPAGDIISFYSNSNYNEAPSCLTVREVLTYAALLRRTDQKSCAFMSPSSPNTHSYNALDSIKSLGLSHDISERVSEIMAIMDLTLVANTIIGPTSSQSRGILPAQLRCLSIAVEIINRANLIFLDDPFYGLDYYDSQAVSVAIQKLSSSGRTVLAALERPRSSAVFGFERMIVIANGGLMIYNGASIKASSYFESIGFFKRWDQSSLEFIIDVAVDRGKLSSNRQSKPRSRSLESQSKHSLNFTTERAPYVITLEDLAEKCRETMSSLPSTALKQVADVERVDSTESGILPNHDNQLIKPSIDVNDYFPPLIPNVQVLLSRGLFVTFSNKSKILLYWSKYLIAGVIIGTVWWELPPEDYQQRIGLLATAYCFVSIVMVDLFDGIYERKELFIREAQSGYSSYLAYWIADSAMIQILNFIGSLVFVLPAYGMTKLRSGPEHVFYFYGIILASIYCNLGLAYIVAFIAPTSAIAKIVFNGFLMPLQVFMSGYLILISSLPFWAKWGAAFNPMAFYLNGASVNEFDGNRNALGTINYNDLINLYDFHMNRKQCVGIIISLGVFYHLIWLVMLKIWDSSTKHFGSFSYKVREARKKAKKFITAGLRWNNKSQASYLNHIPASTVTNAMMEDSAYNELETGILGKSVASSTDLGRPSAFKPGKSILEQLNFATSELPDEYVPLSGGPLDIVDGGSLASGLGRRTDSLGASGGHVDI